MKLVQAVSIASALTVATCLADPPGRAVEPEKKKTKLAFVTNAPADFWQYALAGVRKAEKELGDVQVEFKYGDGTPDSQRRIIDQLLKDGVRGIAICPAHPDAQKDQIKRWAQRASVICVDSDSPGSRRLAHIGTDEFKSGQACGKQVKKALPDGGKIMVFVGIGSHQNSVARFGGLEKELEGSGIEILGLKTDEANPEMAKRNALDTLVRFPDIDGMVGLWSYNPPAILEAVRAAGKVGNVKIFGFDEDPVTLKAIAKGEIYSSICQQPFEFGYRSVKLLHKTAVEGKKIEDGPKDNKYFIPTLVVKKETAAEHLKKCQTWKKQAK